MPAYGVPPATRDPDVDPDVDPVIVIAFHVAAGAAACSGRIRRIVGEP